MKEFYRLRRGGKTYRIKRFSTLVELCKRGLIGSREPVFIPGIKKWVHAGGIGELSPFFKEGAAGEGDGAGPDEEGRPPGTREEREGEAGASQFSRILDDLKRSGLIDESIEELPIDFCEPLKSIPEEKGREKKEEGWGADIIQFPLKKGPSEDRENGEMEGQGEIEGGGEGEAGDMAFPVSFEEWIGRRSDEGAGGTRSDAEGLRGWKPIVMAKEKGPSSWTRVNLLRVFVIVFIGFIVLKVIHFNVKRVAEMDFPAGEEDVSSKIEGNGKEGEGGEAGDSERVGKKGEGGEMLSMTAREMEIRKRVNKGATVDGAVQDRLLSEMINAGARCVEVKIETPPLKKGRRMAKEMTIHVTLRQSHKTGLEEQLGITGIVVGKYMKKARLPVKNLNINFLTKDGRTFTYRTDGETSFDFYTGKISLNEFLRALQ